VRLLNPIALAIAVVLAVTVLDVPYILDVRVILREDHATPRVAVQARMHSDRQREFGAIPEISDEKLKEFASHTRCCSKWR
jgi:hypothetical protein